MIELIPIIERANDEKLAPWKIETSNNVFIELSSQSDFNEIGAVIWQLFRYNYGQDEFERNFIPKPFSKFEIIETIINDSELVLPGGLKAVKDKFTIFPSCCCGLEDCGEWRDIFEKKLSPWLGHDPSPWVEILNEKVRIWSDGGLEPVDSLPQNAFYIECENSQLKLALGIASKNLADFSNKIKSWADNERLSKLSLQLSKKFSSEFNI